MVASLPTGVVSPDIVDAGITQCWEQLDILGTVVDGQYSTIISLVGFTATPAPLQKRLDKTLSFIAHFRRIAAFPSRLPT
eukprot:6710510-Lingulodinium_polyedra.AAC.1